MQLDQNKIPMFNSIVHFLYVKKSEKISEKGKVTNFDPKMVQKHSQERNQSEDLKNIGWTTKDTCHAIFNNRLCIFTCLRE